MQKIRVFLADHNTLFREGLARLLMPQPDFIVVGEAGSSQEGVTMIRQSKPDLVLMDIAWPNCDGLRLVQQIKREIPEVTIIVLTAVDDEGQLFEAIRRGARGYVLKNVERALKRLLRTVCSNGASLRRRGRWTSEVQHRRRNR